MIYLLGGPPRVGKSLIAGTITSTHGISFVSTDTLGAVLEAVLDPEAEPDLFVVSSLIESPPEEQLVVLREPEKRLGYQVRESHAVWKAVEPFALRETEEGRDVGIEGVAVLPELVRGLEVVDHRAVFLGNQGSEHAQNIKAGAAARESDWMRFADDAYIDAFAAFVVEMSRYIEAEARKHGHVYIEMDGRPFPEAVTAVVDALME
jgi:2-phosphoglycerate kinase